MEGKPRPKIKIQMPTVGGTPTKTNDVEAGIYQRPPPMLNVPLTPMGAPLPPMTPGVPMTAGVHMGPMGPMGMFQHYYPTKASDFVFKQFSGIKDFTVNTAKSGLSIGEKTAFWFFSKVRHLSKRWFTHLFLFIVMLGYSILGAVMFVAVEGPHEDQEKADITKSKLALLDTLRVLSRDVTLDNETWEFMASERLTEFEDQLYKSYAVGVTDNDRKVWGFWNAMFYCGTVYTTIGEYVDSFSSH